jgi:hypothetical protein
VRYPAASRRGSPDRVAAFLAAATFLFHLAFASGYDVFRDELYFIVCGRHPAFGYADQPPPVPSLAAGFYDLGHNQYYLWGQRGQSPDNIMRATQHPELWRPHCDAVEIFGKTFSPYAIAYENGKSSILLCRHMRPSLARYWPELKNYS